MDNLMESLFPPVKPENSIFLKGNVPSSKNSKEIGFYYLSKEKLAAGEKSNWLYNLNGTYKMIRPSLRNSDIADEYIKAIVDQIITNKPIFKKMAEGKPLPLKIQLHFVRKTHGRWDFHNLVQIIADCITGSYWKNDPQIPHIATQWITDDDILNALFLPPMEAPFYSVDSKNPGVYISVL